MNANVQKAYNQKADPRLMTWEIPNSREPEFGFELSDMSDHFTIYNALSDHPDVAITKIDKPVSRYLISLAEDTVNNDGYPTRLVRSLNLERRRRQSLYPEDNSLKHYDISYKDALKTSMRREWEEHANCLRSGEEGIIAKVTKDIPDASILDPDSYRVSSVCITSRASYGIVHRLEKSDAAVMYEICNDACVFTNPHADHLLGYRKEVELEGKKILSNNARSLLDDYKNDLLDESIDTLSTYLNKIDFKGLVRSADISKVAHANEMVRLHYDRDIPPARNLDNSRMDGLGWALLQNVKAWDFTFPNKREALARLAKTIPEPKFLTPVSSASHLQGYFPDNNNYSPFPDPCLRC